LVHTGDWPTTAEEVFCAQDGVKPECHSDVHLIADHSGRPSPRYRLPETTRHADSLSRAALR
jgi:hypothetical protein